MTLQDAYSLAETRGWDRASFDYAVERRDRLMFLGTRVYQKWEDIISLIHWSNVLTEDEMESVTNEPE